MSRKLAVRWVMKAYTASLRLYPKRFRDTYGRQMTMTAEDTLSDAGDGTRFLRTVMQLAGDLVTAAAKENWSRLTEVYEHPEATAPRRPVVSVLMMIAKISLVLIIGVVTLAFAAIIFVYAAYGPYLKETYGMIDGFEMMLLIGVVVPLLTVLLIFFTLHQSTMIPVWPKLVWTSGLSLLAGTTSWLLSWSLLVVFRFIRPSWNADHIDLVFNVLFLAIVFRVTLSARAYLERRAMLRDQR